MEPKVIGMASWQGPTVAELWGFNVWVARVNGVQDTQLERNLTSLYADRIVYGGPSDGFYGYAILKDLAEQMGGRFRFIEPDPPQGEVVY
jgi:hypothetical protein